jgi:hypothetical protein
MDHPDLAGHELAVMDPGAGVGDTVLERHH